jgi:hypothetical protein
MLTRSTSTTHRRVGGSVPIGRAEPQDIAGVIAFLASDDVAYINGASLDANAGIFAAQAGQQNRVDFIQSPAVTHSNVKMEPSSALHPVFISA